MCGRFTSKATKEEIEKEFAVEVGSDGANGTLAAVRYNIAPGQIIAAVRETSERRKISPLKWGLIPTWAKDDSVGSKMINARAETIGEKPSFREAFKSRRCVIPASGFYEWQKTDRGAKQPFYFYLKEKEVFGFAGLWEEWLDKQTGDLVETCAIITTEANAVLKPVHNRMPVILQEKDYDCWLDEKLKDKGKLQNLLSPYPAKEMDSHAVSQAVNITANDSDELVIPLNSR